MPLTPLNGTLGKKRAAHLLRRATFGPTKAQIDEFANLTAQAAVQRLFAAQAEPNPPIDPETGATWVDPLMIDTSGDDGAREELFKRWWLGQMLAPGASAREKIVFFLHTHFTTIQTAVESSHALYFQNALFRQFAFDGAVPEFDFKTLSKKICLDNAMIKFLDGDLNVKGSVNENFAREFLELYTIGRGREGLPLPQENLELGDYFYFTEQDVRAGAFVLSGYNIDRDFATIDPDTGLPRGVIKGGLIASQHEEGAKQFSARFGNQVIQPDPALLDNGQDTEASVLDELDQLVDMIYAQPETLRHICRRIYRFFVYHNITDAINNDIITAMATELTNNGFKLQTLLETLFSSQHFYDTANADLEDDNFGAIIKSPLDLAVGLLRFFEVPIPDNQIDVDNFYGLMGSILSSMQDQGMNLYEPFEVAGYAAYHQFPEFNRNWISTNALTQRYQLIRETITTEGMMEPGTIGVDILAFAKQNIPDNIALDPDLLVREFASYLLPRFEEGDEITSERLEYFKSEF
ncbi:MAG: DUF1800 family protein, partial [Bacteroidota bacterium]